MAKNIEALVSNTEYDTAELLDEDEGPEWSRKDILDELLNERKMTYKLIGEQYEVDPDLVSEIAHNHGVNPGRSGAIYDGKTVPFAHSSGDWKGSYEQYEFPVPGYILEELDLERPEYGDNGHQGSLLRYQIVMQDDGPVLVVETSPGREGRDRVFGNERRLSGRPSNHHGLARPPKDLVHATGLNVEGDNETEWGRTARDGYYTGRDVTLETQEDLLVAQFDPGIQGPLFSVDREKPPEYTVDAEGDLMKEKGSTDSAGAESIPVEPQTVKLHPLREGDWEDVPASPRNVEKYRLDIPLTYHHAYDLGEAPGGEGDEGDYTTAVIRYGTVEETINPEGTPETMYEPALIVEFGETVSDDDPGLQRSVPSYKIGNSDDDRAYIYPGRALIHAFGIGIGDPNEDMDLNVRLDPGDGRIAIRPATAEETELYNPLAPQ